MPGLSPKRSIDLVQLDLPAISALASGDLDTANRSAPVVLTSYFVSADCIGTWRYRSKQLRAHPEAATWTTRVVLDLDRGGLPVGIAGYHGPPNDIGTVEVGYGVDPTQRRKGYARAALEQMLDRAEKEPDVHTVRATIAPDNAVSRALVLSYGFVPVGEQWDEEDGLEIIFELSAGGSP